MRRLIALVTMFVLLAPTVAFAGLTLTGPFILPEERGGFGISVTAQTGYPKNTAGAFSFSATIPFTDLSGSLACGQLPALTGNVTTSGCAATIAALAVTNGMLAGSIAASKLVGTDITTVGTLTAGTASTGFVLGGVTVTVGSDATGDLHYRDSGGVFKRLAVGTSSQALIGGTVPAWGTPALATTVTTNANLTGPITSSGNATSIASQTGTGTKFVVDTSPTLVTPVLGVATGTSVTLSALSSINANSASLPTTVTGSLFRLLNADSTVTGLLMDSAAAANTISGRRTAGTIATPVSTTTNAILLGFDGYGYHTEGSAGYTAAVAQITLRSNEVFTDTANGTIITFATTPTGTATAGRVVTMGPIGMTIGATNLTTNAGALGMTTVTAAASAPGAAGGKIEVRCGTGAGTLKIVAYGGTSSTGTTVIDNVGAGVTGC